MKIVALMAVRDEARYLRRSLEHLIREGVEALVIDNDSTDGSLEIARELVGRGVLAVERLPFRGAFELEAQLRLKERLARELDADWFLHVDADEIRQAPRRHPTLHDGIAAADAQGFDAIDFDEFVFLPTAEEPSFEERDWVREMRHYYYYEPESADRYRITAWRKTAEVDLHTFAGHRVLFPGQRLCPERFILRHYPVLSREHAVEKYGRRVFSPEELARGWHGDRALFGAAPVALPPSAWLRRLGADEEFDRSERWTTHPLFGGHPPAPSRRDAAPAGAAVAPAGMAVAPTAERRGDGRSEIERLRAEITALEAQLRAWIRTAEILGARAAPAPEPGREAGSPGP